MVALSVTTVGALLASIQGSALLIALPEIMTHLQTSFLTIMWAIPEFHAHHHRCGPSGRQAGRHVRQEEPLQRRLRSLHSWVATGGLSQPQYHGWDLVLFREVPGLGGALLLTNSAAIVTDAFRHDRIGFGLGVSQIAFAAGFLVGPVVGGILAAISWRWIFLISVPLGVFGILWRMSRLREPV